MGYPKVEGFKETFRRWKMKRLPTINIEKFQRALKRAKDKIADEGLQNSSIVIGRFQKGKTGL
jgi:hypothetical protein